ncbi:MAG: DUF6785 family protein, partial [Thermodesulfobacteriota bacterium]
MTAGKPAPEDFSGRFLSRQDSQPAARLRLRALVAGLAGAVLLAAVTPFNNAFLQGTPLGGGHFPLAPFVLFLLLALATCLVRALFRGYRLFSGQELLYVWVLMAVVSGIAYTGLVRTLFINLTAPFQFATAENRWQERLQPLLPDGWYPEPAAIETLYNGLPEGRSLSWLEVVARIPWPAWSQALVAWAGFVLLAYLAMLCLVHLVGRQWLVNERMNLPLLRVPMVLAEAVDSGGLARLLRDRYLLAGLSLPVCLHLVNGLHFYYPAVPQIPTLILAGIYFPPAGLLAGFAKLKICIYPAFIGFAFLAARQISFSFWFFHLAAGLLVGLLAVLGYHVPAAALGVTFGPTLSRPEEMQMIGAYGVFFLFLLWLARANCLLVLRQAVGLDRAAGAAGIRRAF